MLVTKLLFINNLDKKLTQLNPTASNLKLKSDSFAPTNVGTIGLSYDFYADFAFS
jgi:hypothetical protein